MANYGRIKSMKAAAIGTIMPWVGDLTEVPKGWLICNGGTVNAVDYPLLAEAIGGTYGNFSFSGSFPNYSGQIGLPNIAERALSDVDSAYFSGNTGIDTTEALNVVQSYIPSSANQHTDNGVPTVIDDAYTSINFSYTPENNFVGRLTGSTISPGSGSKTVYTSSRKLGRRHMPRHSHPNAIATINRANSARPGRGVGVWGDIQYNFARAAFDDLDGTTTVDVSVNEPQGREAFGSGTPGVVLANVSGENPQYNLIPSNAASHGLSSWFGSNATNSAPYGTPSNTPAADEYFNTGDTIPYGPSGQNTTAPNPNFDPGGGNSGDSDSNNFKVFYNNAALSFNQNVSTVGRQDVIQPHSHDSFDINFDTSTLNVPNTTTVNVTSNVTPSNLYRALNINVTTNTPALIVLYLIRAY